MKEIQKEFENEFFELVEKYMNELYKGDIAISIIGIITILNCLSCARSECTIDEIREDLIKIINHNVEVCRKHGL